MCEPGEWNHWNVGDWYNDLPEGQWKAVTERTGSEQVPESGNTYSKFTMIEGEVEAGKWINGKERVENFNGVYFEFLFDENGCQLPLNEEKTRYVAIMSNGKEINIQWSLFNVVRGFHEIH